MCWYCVWGMPKPVAEIYQRAVADLDGDNMPLEFGPGHVVWSDFNFDHAESCLKHFEEYSQGCDYSSEQLAIVRRSLEELARLPLDVRDPAPEIPDGMTDEDVPPPPGVVMVKVN